MDNLPELRDIHLPKEINLFPLGFGSIMIIVLLIILILSLPYFRYLYLKSKKKYARDILQGLKEKNMSDVCKISELLRRICKIKHKKAVALYGKEWAEFLNKTGGLKLSKEQMDILVSAPYAPPSQPLSEQDFKSMQEFASQWVENNL